MPRSLSSRCHRAASGRLLTTHLCDGAALCKCQQHLKKPSETSAPETLQQTKHPSPAMEESREAERVTFRSLKARGQEGKGEWADSWGWQLGYPREAQGSINPGGNGPQLLMPVWTKPLEWCWESCMEFYFTSGWYSHSKGGIWRGRGSNLTLNAWGSEDLLVLSLQWILLVSILNNLAVYPQAKG